MFQLKRRLISIKPTSYRDTNENHSDFPNMTL